MSPASFPRWAWWLLGGLAAFGILNATSSSDDGVKPTHAEIRAAASRSNKPGVEAVQKSRGQGIPRVELERLTPASRPTEAEVSNVFGATSWYVPPPPPPPEPPPPPPKPTAPPMPFAYLGSYDGGSKLIIILSKGDRVYTVSPGDVIEGTYRVESIKGLWLEMTYLPLKIRQTINTAGA